MDLITFPLKIDMKGEQVANLQQALLAILERGLILRDFTEDRSIRQRRCGSTR